MITRHSLLLLAAVLALPAQTLDVTPGRALFDEAPVIRVRGLAAGERVGIRADLADGAEQTWTAQAEFVADAHGEVDVSQQASIAGSYKGVSPAGLIWAMRPDSRGTRAYQPPKNLGSQGIEFQLLVRRGEAVARARFEQLQVADGVERVEVRDEGLRGVLFLPSTRERARAVLVVGGSNGGVPVRTAAWLASRGFVALALAYFRYEDLPPRLEAIPLEYFGRALEWLARRPEVEGSKVAVVGTSRGGELALQLGAMYPRVGAVVAYVPADVRFPACCGRTEVPYAWTWQGKPLAWAMPGRRGEASRAEIAVENTKGPVLVISGGEDGIWRSSEMTAEIERRLKRDRFAYSFERLNYPRAGHRAGSPGISPAWHGTTVHPVSGRAIDLGGSPVGDAESTLDAMPKVLRFLRTEFRP